MRKRGLTRTVLLACGLALAGVYSTAPPARAECPLPPGWTAPGNPSVTAQQVDDGSASLRRFARAAARQIEIEAQTFTSFGQALALGCHIRQEGSGWRSASTYLVLMTPDGRLLAHAEQMALAARQLDAWIYSEILYELGVETAVLNDLFSSDPATVNRAYRTVIAVLTQKPDAYFDATTPIRGLRPGIPGASGHAAVYVSEGFGVPILVLAGFDLEESHLQDEVFDYGNPSVTASEVVDRETLKTFVTQAVEHFHSIVATGDSAAGLNFRAPFRDPEGPWRHGSVYLYVLDLSSNIILFHGAFPDRFELRPLVATVRDAVTGKLILPQIIEAARSSPEGGFVQYYFDDPADDTDSADLPKVGYAREFTVEGMVRGTPTQTKFLVGSGFYSTTPPAGEMTTFVPVVLSAYGKNDSFFTSELALTNRGSEAATLNFTYTGRDGVGTGSATDRLRPRQQKVAPDALDYLSSLGIPMPEIANRIGTLRVGVSDSSDVSVVVRTTTPTAVPQGRAGLAYLGVPQDEGFHQQAVYLCGLRDTAGDRSNVALQNMGSEGSITLRTTVFSGNPTDPAGKRLQDMVLGPGEFHQFGEVLKSAGKADPRFGGYVRVERVEGEAPFYAYGVINDNANSDGSFVFPVSAASLEGAMSQTLPALVEINEFTTELTLTNFSDQPKSLMFNVTHERIDAEGNTAGFGPVPMLPGQQLIIPQALAYARQTLGLEVPTGLAAPLVASPVSGDLSGVVIGARVVAPAEPQDSTKGQYGVFYTAVPRGTGFTGSAWVDGLQQNEENRSNLALINTGEVDDQDIVFELDIYDGETTLLVRTVTLEAEPLTRVPAKAFRQINGILGAHAPGTTQGYVRIRKVSGANPFLAYGVVNDGGAPGQRTGDGAYIPARE